MLRPITLSVNEDFESYLAAIDNIPSLARQPDASDTQINAEIQTLRNNELNNYGSITPTTVGDITSFLYDPVSLQNFRIKLHELCMVQHKIHLNNHMNNRLLRGVDEKLGKINQVLKELHHINMNAFIFKREYQVDINPFAAVSVSAAMPASTAMPASVVAPTTTVISASGPLVTRFGIYSSALSLAAHDTDNNCAIHKDQLHLVEKEIFKWALQELAQRDSAETFYNLPAPTVDFAQNVVVVDIFAREGGNKIKIDTQHLPETHCIVLWKQTDTQIVLIDPSQKLFSERVGPAVNALPYDPAIRIPFILSILEQKEPLYASGGNPTGYTDYSVPTPLPRDCIDIAIKIAFEINEQQKNRIPLVEIEKNIYDQISNSAKRATHAQFINGTCIRELQSSKKGVREFAKKFLSRHPAGVKIVKPGNLTLATQQEIMTKQQEENAKKAKAMARTTTKSAPVAQSSSLYSHPKGPNQIP